MRRPLLLVDAAPLGGCPAQQGELQMSHFIELCKICGDVISQCRCPDPRKEKRYGVCEKCAAQQLLAPDLGWVCGKCKTVNDEERSLCGFCDTPRLSG